METTKSPRSGPSLKAVIYAALACIAALHLLSSLPAMYSDWRAYRLAQRVESLNRASNDLFQAVRNYGFERGRVNVVLGDSGPVAGMAKNRAFVRKKRESGDRHLAEALNMLSRLNLAGKSKLIENVFSKKAVVKKLRARAASDMLVPKARRDPRLPDKWFPAMTSLIGAIDDLLVLISQDISDADGKIARYMALQHKALALRNTSGPEMSILAATMLSGKPINPRLVEKVKRLQVRTGVYFQELEQLSAPLTATGIPAALERLKKVYFDLYLPRRAAVFPAAQKGGPYPYSQPQFLSTGVKALESIASFMDEVVLASSRYAEHRKERALEELVVQGLINAGTLGLILLAFGLVHFRVIRPVTDITGTMRRLAAGDLRGGVPASHRRDEVGDMARAVEVFKQNSIQLRRDMEARRLAVQALRESQAALARAQKVAHVGSWELDLTSGHVSWSEEMYRIAGRDQKGEPPGRDSLLDLCVPEDKERLREALERAHTLGEPYRLTYTIFDSEGSARDVNEIVEVLAPENGAPRRLVGTVQDVTDMRRLEAQMLQAQKLESLGVVAGGIAHDFNNILAGVMGYAELGLDHGDLKPPLREYLEKILGLGQRAADISHQMLAYSGKDLTRRRRLDVSENVRQMSALLSATVPKKARLHMELGSGLPAIVADPAQLSQVTLNLLTNAAEALPDTGGDIIVRSRLARLSENDLRASFLYEGQPAGDYLILEFEDTGQGIEPENLDKVFDPFFTTKFTGRGLGLAVVLGIVRGLGGALAVSSRPGRGSRFTLMFPVDEHTQAVEPEPPVSPVAAPAGGGEILLIDDEEPVREVAAKILSGAGYRVITAANGREGLARFRANAERLDLVILDMTLPDLNGDEIYPLMARERPGVKVLMASGYSEESLSDRFAMDEIAGFVQKPWRMRELLDAVNSILAG